MRAIEGQYVEFLEALGTLALHDSTPEKARRDLKKEFFKVKDLMGVLTPIVVDSKAVEFPTAVLSYAKATAALLERSDLPADIWAHISDAEGVIERLLAPDNGLNIPMRIRAIAEAYCAHAMSV